jgi:hypothetical protein
MLYFLLALQLLGLFFSFITLAMARSSQLALWPLARFIGGLQIQIRPKRMPQSMDLSMSSTPTPNGSTLPS